VLPDMLQTVYGIIIPARSERVLRVHVFLFSLPAWRLVFFLVPLVFSFCSVPAGLGWRLSLLLKSVSVRIGPSVWPRQNDPNLLPKVGQAKKIRDCIDERSSNYAS
jgi:hypothetical protein